MKIFCKKNKNLNGFALIEIMVAISILSLTFISLMYAFPFGTSVNKRANSATIASHLSQKKIEELRSLGYDNISEGTIEDKIRLSSDPSNYLYHFQRETIVYYVDNSLQVSISDIGMKLISVTVYYIDAASKTEKSYNISTLISQR